MNKIDKIIIKSYCKLTEGAVHKSKFILKDNYIFYEDFTENPNCSMFVADFYDTYNYKINSDAFKENYLMLCKEVHKLFESEYQSKDKSMKFTATIYYGDKTKRSCIFYSTLEEMGLDNLARLFKLTITPCEYYPHWLEANELYLDEKTIEFIQKIKNGEI